MGKRAVCRIKSFTSPKLAALRMRPSSPRGSRNTRGGRARNGPTSRPSRSGIDASDAGASPSRAASSLSVW
jgi:hypothetical protein